VSGAGEHLVHLVRDTPAPWKVDVTGAAAQLIDSKAAIFSRVPLALGIIALITFVALFFMFGGLLVPIKAIVLNLLSLTATFGAMVWVFQDGHAAGLLHFTPTGTLDINAPILIFCIAFGLSMDYEVFLLSRIKEEHDRGATTVASVAVGLERTGRIVTAAAALLAVVFIGLGASHVTFIKLFGLGLTLAVIMDATLIRGLLVPAFMRLAGNANWWAPTPLRRLHNRFGLRESPPDASPEGGLPELTAVSSP
jgi:RND superfamily putative drug exporter